MDNTILKNKILSYEGNALIFQPNGILMYEIKSFSSLYLDNEVLKIFDSKGMEFRFSMYEKGKERLIKDCTIYLEESVLASFKFTYDNIGDTIVDKNSLSTESIEDNCHM